MDHEDTKTQIINNLISAIIEKKVYCISNLCSIGYQIAPTKNKKANIFTIIKSEPEYKLTSISHPNPITIHIYAQHGKLDIDQTDPLFKLANELYTLVTTSANNDAHLALLNATLALG